MQSTDHNYGPPAVMHRTLRAWHVFSTDVEAEGARGCLEVTGNRENYVVSINAQVSKKTGSVV